MSHFVVFLSNLIVKFLAVLTISSSFFSKSYCCLINSSILGFYLNFTVFNKLFSNDDANIWPAYIYIVESPMQMIFVINFDIKQIIHDCFRPSWVFGTLRLSTFLSHLETHHHTQTAPILSKFFLCGCIHAFWAEISDYYILPTLLQRLLL